MKQSTHPTPRLMLACGLAATLLAAGCGKSNSYKAPPPPAVVISHPVMMPMTTYLNENGNTVAANSVQLVARVAGYLDSVDYVDGTNVKKGQKLFVIEPEPYAAKVTQAEAAVAQAKAQVTYAQSQYDRQLDLAKQNATSTAEVENWLSQKQSAQAAVISAMANLQIAQINFGYTTITAPFDGRVDRHLVDPGNLVGNGTATALATIDQLAPIYVYFNVNEIDLLKIRTALIAHGKSLSQAVGAPIAIGLQNETGFPHQGKIDYVATDLDQSTGTIEVRAVFTNADDRLLPGLFVRAQIPLGQPVMSMAVPDAAVQSDQAGSYVLVIGPNNIVAQQRVQTGIDQNGMIAVTGLPADAQVIVDGIQNATPGAAVKPTEKDLAAPKPASGQNG